LAKEVNAKGYAGRLLERLTELLDEELKEIEHYTRPTREGKLGENDYGKFELGDRTFSCGSPLEVFIDGEWWHGRVEATDGQYYFYNEQDRDLSPNLYRGMTVRVRLREVTF
jgi:hypothetical protein